MASQTIFSLSPAINPSSPSSPSQLSLDASRCRPVSFPRLPIVASNLSFRAKSNSSRIVSIRYALSPELKTTMDKVVTSQKVILFMKGTRDFPQSGFSNTVVQILNLSNVPYETINILDNEVLYLRIEGVFKLANLEKWMKSPETEYIVVWLRKHNRTGMNMPSQV